MTYKALEQFSESEFDLDRLEAAVKKTRQSQNLDSLVLNTAETSRYKYEMVQMYIKTKFKKEPPPPLETQ